MYSDLPCLNDSFQYKSETFKDSGPSVDELIAQLPWKTFPIVIFGKTYKQPRQICFFSDPGLSYTYSRTRLEGLGWPPLVAPLKEALESATGHRFNSVLCNLYRNGEDSMGWHSDNEPELGPWIASLSFGATRKMKIRDKKTKRTSGDLLLEHGSLLLMKPGAQELYEHSIPKSKKVSTPRVNLTFRQIRV